MRGEGISFPPCHLWAEESEASSLELLCCGWGTGPLPRELLGYLHASPTKGSWDPVLAQASHLEELEHLRSGFAQQQQQERAQHESELEHLRVYFEKKLKDAEKTYQEDLTVFQQRLQEAREDSLESTEIR